MLLFIISLRPPTLLFSRPPPCPLENHPPTPLKGGYKPNVFLPYLFYRQGFIPPFGGGPASAGPGVIPFRGVGGISGFK